MQKSVLFLYANYKKSEKEIKNIIPFTVVSNRRKYLEINFNQGGERLYTENHKALLREIRH